MNKFSAEWLIAQFPQANPDLLRAVYKRMELYGGLRRYITERPIDQEPGMSPRQRKVIESRPCAWCEKPIKSPRPYQKYCSRQCRGRSSKLAERSRIKSAYAKQRLADYLEQFKNAALSRSD